LSKSFPPEKYQRHWRQQERLTDWFRGKYELYKAEFARATSLAGGSPFESFTNRSYKGKTTVAVNIQDMKTVEEQMEDVPRDMKCYTDSEGNTYDFAFGMNWSGIINDARIAKYKNK